MFSNTICESCVTAFVTNNNPIQNAVNFNHFQCFYLLVKQYNKVIQTLNLKNLDFIKSILKDSDLVNLINWSSVIHFLAKDNNYTCLKYITENLNNCNSFIKSYNCNYFTCDVNLMKLLIDNNFDMSHVIKNAHLLNNFECFHFIVTNNSYYKDLGNIKNLACSIIKYEKADYLDVIVNKHEFWMDLNELMYIACTERSRKCIIFLLNKQVTLTKSQLLVESVISSCMKEGDISFLTQALLKANININTFTILNAACKSLHWKIMLRTLFSFYTIDIVINIVNNSQFIRKIQLQETYCNCTSTKNIMYNVLKQIHKLKCTTLNQIYDTWLNISYSPDSIVNPGYLRSEISFTKSKKLKQS